MTFKKSLQKTQNIQSKKNAYTIYLFFMEEDLAGAAGIEPANHGIKTRCLTTWLRPNTPGGLHAYLRAPESLTDWSAGRPLYEMGAAITTVSFFAFDIPHS